MRNNNRDMIRYVFITCLVIVTIVFSTGCSRHLSAINNGVKSNNNEGKKASSSGYSLIGTWHLDKVEAPDLVGKLASFGSQQDVDHISKTLAQSQNSLKGLTVTFNEDGTYQSVYSGQSDVGKWSVNETKEIRAVSKVTSNVELYQIISQTDTSIQAQITQEDVNLLLTFTKK